MKKEFVTYDIAAKLKNLGFDEECLATYFDAGEEDSFSDWKICFDKTRKSFNNTDEFEISAPLWQQCLNWFKTKHDIHINPNFYENRFSHEMCYEYIIYRKVDGEWKRISVSCENPLETAIYEAFKIIENGNR